jgi:two-component system, NtrC family, sensor histidine kinase HydH
MSKKEPGVRRIVLPLLLLFAVLAALGVYIVVGESRRSRLVTEYEAERMASLLVESMQDRGSDEAPELDERVLGFGLYGARGNPAYRWGDAPESMRGVAAKEVFTYDPSGRRLSLTRPLGMRMAAMGDQSMRSQGRRMGAMGGGATGYLYLSLDVSDYFRRRGLLAPAAVAVPLIAAALAAALIYLISSNARYRRAAEERETLARLGESARTLAHEIRNPLSAIRIQTGILRQARPEAGDSERSALDAIDEETERLSGLSRRVGDFLRNPAGAPERVDLDAFLRDLAGRSPHRPRYSSDGKCAAVMFDPELLRSAVENLLRNARESYGEREGEVEMALSASAGKRGRRAVIAVRDRGRGLPEESMEKAFDPFYTGKPSGFGIGLPLARGFVEAAGGELSLRPREGGGAEARIELPIAEEA